MARARWSIVPLTNLPASLAFALFFMLSFFVFVGVPSEAQAACVPGAPGVVDCTGNVSGGANFHNPPDPYTTLNVNNLTVDITPAPGISGVGLIGQGTDQGSAGCTVIVVACLGDDGSDGGGAPSVTVNFDGTVGPHSITTQGANGVVGISYGGDGGNGGNGGGVGGTGGDAGNGAVGGAVIIDSKGNITTTGNNANGIMGLSVGGNGGIGGDFGGVGAVAGDGGDAAGGGSVHVTSASTIHTSGDKSNGIVAQSTGGAGGAGGSAGGVYSESGGGGQAAPGGNVTVDNSGGITTLGKDSVGILAQSIGGFGGGGGSGGGLVAFGGSGASAGPGGIVIVNNSGSISTTEEGAHGILAQSIGGGGGSAGSAGGLVALGADGSIGGNGQAVTVTTTGTGHIETSAANAKGIYAQSIGGGGGDGGNSGGLVSIGGSGSTTSGGGKVTVANSQAITTNGDRSDAIYAQSVGGGGGNGGVSGGLVSIGGSGGGGGDGGEVEVDNSGELNATGEFSRGIFAQSIGGGGGDGGFSGGLISVGGSGAAGGTAVLVDVTNSGKITTQGNNAAGIFAQSVGGGGGSGGNSVAAGVFVSMAFGGKGGPGGDGGLVNVNLDQNLPVDISTTGDHSAGIFAQSVGGGGGDGGFAISASVGLYGNVSLAFGGSGASGGDAKAVYVAANGSIKTLGNFSSGIVAESIGGGGGNGGFAISVSGSTGVALGMSFGAKGGAGGVGGDVKVVNLAHITTGCATCTGSAGILASSIGGGGGDGGFAINVSGGLVSALGMSFGGAGGEGNNGGIVDVESTANIKTTGTFSNGITAQSLGGGGGNGGFAGTGTLSLQGPNFGLAFGGGGGDGAFGSTVDVANVGNIATDGDFSHGIFAQSVGGGGGSGGFAGALAFSMQGPAAALAFGGSGGEGSEGGDVTVRHTGEITTTGKQSVGILAQSIGGGGGTGGFSLGASASINQVAAVAALGGSGGDGGGSGKVTVTDIFGKITTAGEQSHGILAQSISGGGGTGGFSVTASFSMQSDTYGLSIGGGGGTTNNAGDVEVINSATIETGGAGRLGLGSHGILAQSIGGGGGTGGFSGAAAFSLKGKASTSSTGGEGGAAGDGGVVHVTSNGAITTLADNSIGILAQSVGGGGGVGGFSVAAAGSIEGDASADSVGGKGAGGGEGDEVKVWVNNNIDTYGQLSHGVLAQSVGGGGGYGGFSLGLGVSIKANSEAKSVGGEGDVGGGGGDVEVNIGSAQTTLGTPVIHTRGEGAVGVIAQSIGGGGGTGGFSGGLAIAIDGGTSNEVGGGNGGAASDGGDVLVNNWGKIQTEGGNAAGILAQSIGGSGGNGGFSIAAALEGQGTNGDGAKSSVGGEAGTGGIGGEVEVNNFGIIETSGDNSHGIIAQSIGGGGGNGGFSIAGTISDSGQGATSSVGGSGGEGGAGGTVTVTNSGTITVTGANSNGIFAQSVGGGGGSGGIAGAFDFGGGGVDNVVGGAGAKGGNGGDVTVESTGSIFTTLANSSGVVAQSVGGSGGWGGLAVGVGSGSDGSDGIKLGLGTDCDLDDCDPFSLIPVDGASGTVKVTINGETNITQGALSYGMIAQAIAGGGGAAATVILDELGFSGSDIELSAGSSGFIGSNATFADNDYNTDHTMTTGVGSIGLIVQSIGGGGGVVGNVDAALVLNPAQPPEDGFYLSAGGYAGGFNFTGSGGGFKLDAAGTVQTTAANAIGIIGQTIGGGGGIVNLTVTSVTNEGDELVINVGGSQLANGGFFGNAVADPVTNPVSTLTAAQLVTTAGALSHGIVAQSIGGGGGVSNVVFENGVVLANGTDITIGSGAGGAGGIGGDLIVNANGVTTTGNGAFGIVAQSIGGGGGLVGVASGTFVLGQEGYSLNPLSIGGGTGAGGDSGVVTVSSTGDIHTAGYGAHGIVAQSIAGGGGIVGNGMFATDIADATANASFAGSLGHDGTSGAVGITQTRNVVVTGMNAVGIFGQSAGGTANGNVTLALNQAGTNGNGVGLVWASNGTGAAVQIADGATNSFTSNGTLYAQSSIYGSGLPLLNGMTILGGDGDDAITNLMRAEGAAITNFTRTSNIIGNVDLGAGANSLLNQSGALFISDASVILGAGNLLTNEGLLSPGDRARVKTTGVTGNTTQTVDGTYYMDLDLNAQNTPDQVNDLLDITGDGDFAGTGGLLLTSINKAFSNDGYVIASAGGTMTDSGFLPNLDPPAVGFIFSTDVIGSDLVLLAEKPSLEGLLQDPASGTTDPNVWRMGEGIDNIEQAIDIDDPFNYLINLLRLQPDVEALGDAITTLTPHGAAHMFELADRRTTEFLDQAARCGDGLVGDALDNRGCVWIAGSGGIYNRGTVLDSPKTEDTWGTLAFGGQAVVYDKVTFGAAGGYGQINTKQTLDGEELGSANGDIYQASVSAAYQDGGFGVSVAAAGTAGAWESRRYVNIGGYSQAYSSFDGIALGVADVGELPVFTDKTIEFEAIRGWAEADREIYAFNPRVRLSYATDPAEGVKAIGLLDIEGHVLYTPEATETGVGLANLVYPEMTQTAVTLTPGFELRLSHEFDNGYQVTGYVRGGVQWSPWKDEWVAETQFAAAPEGLPAIEMIEPFDDLRGKLDVGMMFECPTSGMQLTVNYAGVYGATTTQHAVKGGFSVPMGGPEKSGC